MQPDATGSSRHVVAALAYHDISPFELAVAHEVFGLDRPELGVDWYRFVVCAVEPGPLRTRAGFTIDTPHGLDELALADTVVVPGWHDIDAPPPPGLLDAIRAAHARGARLLSVCSGAFVLAATGLLDGRPATTHWMYTAKLASRFPNVDVRPDVLYVDDGDVLTSAGTGAGIDLCLHVVRLDYGAAIANAVARRMVVPPHRQGGQAQYVDQPLLPGPDQDGLADTLDWMLQHLGEPLTIERLARRVHQSPRTLARRFKATTGTTPLQWLLGQRLLHARNLLETTDEPVERIAHRCGFGSPATMRQHFQRSLEISPVAYRRTFQPKAAQPS